MTLYSARHVFPGFNTATTGQLRLFPACSPARKILQSARKRVPYLDVESIRRADVDDFQLELNDVIEQR